MAHLSQPRLPLLRGLAGGYKGAGTGPRLPEPKAVSPRRDERPAFSWCLTLSLSSLLWWLLLDGIGRVPSLGLHGFSVVLNLATMIVLMFLAGLTLATALWVAEQLLADRKGYRSGTATLVVLYVLVDYVFVMYFRRLMGQPESIPFEKTRALYPVLFLLGLLLYRIRFKDELEWLRVQARAYTSKALRWLVGLLVAALLVLLGAAVHTALAPAMKVPQTLPHIVVITSDSMRSRNLSLYGYWRQTTPQLDSLAQNSYVFNRFRTNYASTRFAMPAFLGYCATLDRCDVNLIDSLRRMGYKRASMIAFSSIAPQVRDSFDRVLVTQDQVNHPLMKAVRAYIDVDAANWLVGFISEPSFAYNLLSTYNPVYVDNRKRIPPQQALAIALELLSQAHEPELVWVHLYQPHWPYDVSNRPLFGNPAISRYDSAIHEVDSALGSLVDNLRRLGLWDHTMLMFSADHGEAVGDRVRGEGKFGHRGDWVIPSVADIPLLIHTPGQGQGERVATFGCELDIAPTLLDLLGQPPTLPSDSISESLVPYMRQPELLSDRVKVCLPDANQTRRGQKIAPDDPPRGWIDAGKEDAIAYWKQYELHWTQTYPTVDGAVADKPDNITYTALFDLVKDPERKHNLYQAGKSPALEVVQAVESDAIVRAAQHRDTP